MISVITKILKDKIKKKKKKKKFKYLKFVDLDRGNLVHVRAAVYRYYSNEY